MTPMRRLPALVVLAVLAAPALLPPRAVQAGEAEGLAAYQRQDWAAAARELRDPAEQGRPAAQARLGHLLLMGQGATRDDAAALRLLRAAAEAGDPLGQYWLGTALMIGRGVPRDPAAAVTWFDRAAAQDQPEALHALGEVYFKGLGQPKDEAKAVGFYRRAAERNVAASQETLAELSWNGRAVPSDHAAAVRYAQPAARAGRPGAQFILGVALATGDGIARNPAEALQWFRRAADQGHPQSSHNLGAMLVSGTGTAASLPEGYFWLALGAERAPPSLKALYERERDQIGARLSPEQLAQARARLAAWRPAQAGGPVATAVVPPPGAAPAEAGRGRGQAGSGFFVTRDGTVLTNAHVVDQCRSITVTPQGGRAVPARILARTEADDIAILKAEVGGVEPARFREDRPLRSGDEVVVVGYPLSSLLSREANVTAGVVSAMAGLRGDQRHYQITAPVQKGNSGGPLADMSGNVVGIVSSKLNAMKIAGQTGDLPQNINFAIKGDLARRYLESNGVRPETAPASASLSAADVGERITRSTVYVECRKD